MQCRRGTFRNTALLLFFSLIFSFSLSLCLSVCPSVCQSDSVSLSFSHIFLSHALFHFFTLCLFLYLPRSIYLFLYFFPSLFIFLSLYISLSPFLSLSSISLFVCLCSSLMHSVDTPNSHTEQLATENIYKWMEESAKVTHVMHAESIVTWYVTCYF